MNYSVAMVAGCMPPEVDCGDALTHATPSDGDSCLGFSSTCTPEGWSLGCPDREMETWVECF